MKVSLAVQVVPPFVLILSNPWLSMTASLEPSAEEATAPPLLAIPHLHELNIGHHMMGEAVFSGLTEVVAKMRTAMDRGRARVAS